MDYKKLIFPIISVILLGILLNCNLSPPTIIEKITCWQCQDDTAISFEFEGTTCPMGWQETEPICTTVNTPPVANDDTYEIIEGEETDLDVLINDVDDDNDILTVVSVTQGNKGSVAIENDGTHVSYYPYPEKDGTDSFQYTISDGNGGTDTATVYITIVV